MMHQINTPTKYAVMHAKGSKAPGLFASYNRSIPKNNPTQNNKCEKSYKKDGYSKIHEKIRNMNVTQDPSVKKEIVDIRVRSSSSNKKYRYNNDTGNSSPRIKHTTKKKKQFKVEQKDSILQSVLDRNMKVIQADPGYMNVKNTIASTSSKKTSNNTSCMISTSSRNASITPRKVSIKMKMNASPE